MSNNKLIVRLWNSQVTNPQVGCTSFQFQRVSGYLNAQDFAKLYASASNKVNPRTATKNSIVKDIWETLRFSPEKFWIMTKGIVVSTTSCRRLERNRFELTLNNEELEGIMDGGHNTFAIASYIVTHLYGNHAPKFSKWDDCKRFWVEHKDEIEDGIRESAELNFRIPLEIIAPLDESMEDVTCDMALHSYDEFLEAFSSICSARNTNEELSVAAISRKDGLYKYLEEEVVRDQVEVVWWPGEGRGCKVDDVIAMACIPLIFLLKEGHMKLHDIQPISKVSIYSQKSKCVKFFRKLLMHKDVSEKRGCDYVLTNETIKSALDLTVDIMRFFNRLYVHFPKLYNKADGKFRRIDDVEKDIKSLAHFHFKEGTPECDCTYPDGFIYPLVCGLTKFMVYTPTGRVQWAENGNPANIDLDKLREWNAFELYAGLIKTLDWDPQKVGKAEYSYITSDQVMENILRHQIAQI